MSRLALLGAGPSGAGAASFDPLTLSPSWLLDGDSLTGNDGDAIATWTASAGNNATQGTGANRPLVKKAANGINGKTVCRFDGTDDELNATEARNTKPFTYAFVLKVTSFAAYRSIVGGADGTQGGISIDVEQTTGKIRLLKEDMVLIGTSTGALVAAQAHVLVVTYDGSGNYVFYIDGTAAGSGTSDQTFTAGDGATSIGRSTGNSIPFLGDMAYIFKKAAVLGATDRQNLVGELGSRYDITVA